MKITVLSENCAGSFCHAEHGLCYLVETKNKYLFDTGHSDLFLKNAEKLRIDLSDVNTVVLSHGHEDHGGGLPYISGKKLIAHPDIFIERFRNKNNTPLGLPMSKDEIKKQFTLSLSKTPLQLDEQTWFLGEIPRITNFESQTTSFHLKNGVPDFVPDDSGIACLTPKGLVVISGCAHAGICNTILMAQSVTKTRKVHAVIGGFHLTEPGEQLDKTINWLKYMQVERVIPSHCTALPALTAIYNEYKFMQTKTGNTIIF